MKRKISVCEEGLKRRLKKEFPKPPDIRFYGVYMKRLSKADLLRMMGRLKDKIYVLESKNRNGIFLDPTKFIVAMKERRSSTDLLCDLDRDLKALREKEVGSGEEEKAGEGKGV